MQEKTLTNTLVPLIVAVLSAATILFGYIYQRNKEREFEIAKTRQEIYVRLVTNLSQKIELLRIAYDDPTMPKLTQANAQEVYRFIAKKYPELDKNFNESIKIQYLLVLYGDDAGIKAFAKFYRDSEAALRPGSQVQPDKNELITELRRSIFPSTTVTAEDVRVLTAK